MVKVLIVYYSRTGHIRKMAEAAQKGAKMPGVEITICESKDCTMEQLLDSDGIVIGSPTYYGLVAGEIKDLFDRSVIHHGKLQGKVGGAFASAGILGGGVETTIMSILQIMLVHGMVIQGQSKGCHYGAVSIGSPDEKALEEAELLGKRVAKLTLKLHAIPQSE